MKIVQFEIYWRLQIEEVSQEGNESVKNFLVEESTVEWKEFRRFELTFEKQNKIFNKFGSTFRTKRWSFSMFFIFLRTYSKNFFASERKVS